MMLDLSPMELQWLAKAEHYCARDEQCASSVRIKLSAWGVPSDSADRIIDCLIDDDFINEHRYVRIYCESKLRLQKWGRRKVAYQLRTKRISNELIAEGLGVISDEQYQEILLSVAQSKWKTYSPGDVRNKERLMAFLVSRGYEMEFVQPICKMIEK